MRTNIKGLDELLKTFSKLDSGVGRVLYDELDKAGAHIRNEARKECPFITGMLKGSITNVTNVTADKIVAEIGTNNEYAVFVEFGTGPKGQAGDHSNHAPIQVSYRPTGWSYQDEDGKWFYTTGYRPRPFLYPAFARNKDKINQKVRDAVVRHLQGVKK